MEGRKREKEGRQERSREAKKERINFERIFQNPRKQTFSLSMELKKIHFWGGCYCSFLKLPSNDSKIQFPPECCFFFHFHHPSSF